MEDYETRKAEIEELKKILLKRDEMIAKSKNIKGKDQGLKTVSNAEADEFEKTEKHSFIPKYKAKKWKRNYDALKTEQ